MAEENESVGFVMRLVGSSKPLVTFGDVPDEPLNTSPINAEELSTQSDELLTEIIQDIDKLRSQVLELQEENEKLKAKVLELHNQIEPSKCYLCERYYPSCFVTRISSIDFGDLGYFCNSCIQNGLIPDESFRKLIDKELL